MHKMFGSKISTTSTSKFYTNLESTDDNEETKITTTSSSSSTTTTTTILEDFHKSKNSRDSTSATSDDGNSQDSDSAVCLEDQDKNEKNQQQYTNNSFPRITNFPSFPRFQHFIMSASTPDENKIVDSVKETTSIVKVSRHSVLEYSSSRYTVTKSNNSSEFESSESYELSESESDEESEGTQSSQTDISSISSSSIADEKDGPPAASKPKIEKIINQQDKKNDIILQRKEKLEKIANELLETEIKYVSILHLIDQVFQFRVDQENRAHSMFPPETVQRMFSNIKSIYKFHNDFLLPQLRERINNNWSIDPRIGDIMKNFAPFLKMYTEYVRNFDNAMNLINTLQQKIPRFGNIISDIQKLDECGKLALTHHMLSPIQRLPRYELLLKDYLKNLTNINIDYEDTKEALKLVSTATNHSNDAMKKIDKFKKLLEIQENIHNEIDLVSHTRELIKEGRIIKISARSGDHQERHLFLFNDILLLCSLRIIPAPLYRLRAKFNNENLQVIEGDNMEIANTFYLRDGNKSVELYTQSADEKTAWLDALFQTMQEIMKRKASLKTTTTTTTNTIVKIDDVNRCMICEAIFSVMKRKHHCRSCGSIVCNKCSSQKIVFEDKQMRVCRMCYTALTQPLSKSPSPPCGPASSLLRVSDKVPCVLSGYLLLKTQATKPWTKRWFALHDDFVLYTFKSDCESVALTATPMPGYTLTEGDELPDEDPLNPKDRKGTFKIHHSRKCYYLHATTLDEKNKWVSILRLAMKAELPCTTQHDDNDNNDDDKNKPN